jgi:thiamine pyrophosphokinase
MNRILIFANGVLPDIRKARELIKTDDLIICADGGTRHALGMGVRPSIVVGDLDSLGEEERKKAENAGAKIVQYSQDKNETDLELAINHALELKPTSVVIIAAMGDRLDQTLGNIALLSDQRLAEMDFRLDDGLEEAFFCRNRCKVHGKSGDLVSLLPWQSAVEGIRTEGLKWPLHNETLYPDKTRGISNQLIGREATVTVTAGLLFIIHRRNIDKGHEPELESLNNNLKGSS